MLMMKWLIKFVGGQIITSYHLRRYNLYRGDQSMWNKDLCVTCDYIGWILYICLSIFILVANLNLVMLLLGKWRTAIHAKTNNRTLHMYIQLVNKLKSNYCITLKQIIWHNVIFYTVYIYCTFYWNNSIAYLIYSSFLYKISTYTYVKRALH